MLIDNTHLSTKDHKENHKHIFHSHTIHNVLFLSAFLMVAGVLIMTVFVNMVGIKGGAGALFSHVSEYIKAEGATVMSPIWLIYDVGFISLMFGIVLLLGISLIILIKFTVISIAHTSHIIKTYQDKKGSKSAAPKKTVKKSSK
ncbi:MAG: hypothetical protein LBV22_03180 [Mycoplasmataceae bacterium]|nr:hypothetical protein [Mycoplasmataceae bacterium]